VVQIAKTMGMSARTIRRLLANARARHLGALSGEEAMKLVADSFGRLEHIAARQWEQYHRAPTVGSALGALAAITRVETIKVNLLRILGLLRPAPTTESPPKAVPPLPWPPAFQDQVASALLAQSVSRPLAEPAPDELSNH
jgi:hypothetical protein